jgi:hypothetical protein
VEGGRVLHNHRNLVTSEHLAAAMYSMAAI